MAVRNSGDALLHLRTLFDVGAIGALADGQLLERFATGRGVPRELAFAALVERHGPFVLRVCRSVLRDEDAAEDAFQATFLALARKAGSLWAQDSLAPWLHQAAYRAAAHDRSAKIRRRSHEHAAAALRPESVAPPHHGNDDDLGKIIHEEIDRLPSRFRVAVVLCDLEDCTHEQAARHLGCAVGTVKSRLARGRKRLRGRLVRRGVAPAAALAAASAGGAARAAVPTGLAESTVVYAATARAVPTSVAVITEGVLISMFLRKVKLVMTAAAVMAALAAGAVALAQSGIGRPKDGTGKPRHVGSPSWTYHILVSRNGEPPRKVAVVEMTGDTPIRVDAPGALILFQPKRDGEPDRQTAAERRYGDIRAEVTNEKTGRSPTDAAANRPIEIVGPASRNPSAASPSGANPSRSENDQEHRKIVLTSPKTMDVNITQRYVCQIHSRRHINLRALEKGYLNEINVREGQAVKQGDLLFKIVSTVNKAKLDAELAEVQIAQLELNNAKKLSEQNPPVVSQNEVRLFQAKLARAQAKADLAKAELDFTSIRAPFDGIVDRLREQQGSAVKEGDILTALSDNSVMWVYFNVPEKQYLEYMADRERREADKIELELADRTKFPQPGMLNAIEAQFNNETGNIPFRADFPNPHGLLRHGQSGTILIHRKVHDATVIPQRATYEIMDKRHVYVVDKDDVVHRREIVVQNEMDDIFVIKKGVGVGDRIVLEGIRRVHDGEKVAYEFRSPEEVMRSLRDHAE
jgi:membrane fusion protein (multidrug efflux system)